MITIQPTPSTDLLEFTVTGKVTDEDYTAVLMPAIDAAIEAHEHIRVLVRFDAGFQGYSFAAMLDDAALHACLQVAAEADLFVLLECFDEDELARAAAAPWSGAQPLWLGVNVRDLRSLAVDPERLARLAPRLPAERVVIAESGIEGVDDVKRAVGLGYRGALVGTALMRAGDPGAAVAALRRAGEEALACS